MKKTDNMKRTIMGTLAAVFAMVATIALADSSLWQRDLPKGARVIETVKVPSKHGQRRLVLWAEDAKEHREKFYGDALTCPEMAKGRHYVDGLLRLSLVDERRSRIINTVPIETEGYTEYLFDNPADGNKKTLAVNVPDPESRRQSVPLDVAQTMYDVPKSKSKGRLMQMRDINGDGLANEFALYSSETCADFNATIVGYSERTDKAIWYNFKLQVNDEGKMSVDDVHWVPVQFVGAFRFGEGVSPETPKNGVWQFATQYPEDPPREYRYEIRYDAAREEFVGTETIVRIP